MDARYKALQVLQPELHLPRPFVRKAVEQLQATLESGTKTQRKQFLRSFVRKIEYEHPRVTIFYSFPIQCDNGGGSGKDGVEEILIGSGIGSGKTVLGTDRPGSSGRTRTYNPPVNRGLPCCCWELRIVADSFIVLHLPVLAPLLT